MIDAARTHWLDETGVNCGMTRLYGRAPAGERVYEYVPDVRFERTSLVGAMGLGGVVAPLAYKGVSVVFLPVYSQDFNPIEHALSKIKACLRKLKARTAGGLLPAMAAALDSVTPEDCRGWIRHCGYGLP